MDMAPFANCHQTLVLVILDHPQLQMPKENQGKEVLEITASFGGTFDFMLPPQAETGAQTKLVNNNVASILMAC